MGTLPRPGSHGGSLSGKDTAPTRCKSLLQACGRRNDLGLPIDVVNMLLGPENGRTWAFLTFLGGLSAGNPFPPRSDPLPLALEVSLRAVNTKALCHQCHQGMVGGVLPARDIPLSN